jgi:hypothetical protein
MLKEKKEVQNKPNDSIPYNIVIKKLKFETKKVEWHG